MKILYDDVEKLAFTLLLVSEAITPQELKRHFDIEESTARNWKSEFLKKDTHLLSKVSQVKVGWKHEDIGLYIKINVNK